MWLVPGYLPKSGPSWSVRPGGGPDPAVRHRPDRPIHEHHRRNSRTAGRGPAAHLRWLLANPRGDSPTFVALRSYLDTATTWGIDTLHTLEQLFTTGPWLPPALAPAETATCEEPEKGRSGGPGMVTPARPDSRIEHMVEPVAAAHAHPVAGAVADMESMLGECAGRPLWPLRDKDIDELLPRAHSLLARVMGSIVLPLVAEADRRDLAAALGAGSTAGWVRDLLRVTLGQARQMVDLARAVVDGGLAATGQALAGGQISAEHAQVIARSVAELPDEAEAWVPAAAEQELLGQAKQYDPRVLGKIGRRILTVVDPDHGDEILGRELERQDKAAREGRQLHATPFGQRRVRVTGWFDTEGWQTVRAALDPLAAPRA